jgi:phage tail-like protein
MIITLLNDLHLPVAVWKVHRAYPVKVSISEFNAEQNTLVIETLKLAYQYYQTVDLSSLLPGIIASISLSASISL